MKRNETKQRRKWRPSSKHAKVYPVHLLVSSSFLFLFHFSLPGLQWSPSRCPNFVEIDHIPGRRSAPKWRHELRITSRHCTVLEASRTCFCCEKAREIPKKKKTLSARRPDKIRCKSKSFRRKGSGKEGDAMKERPIVGLLVGPDLSFANKLS